MKAFILSLCLSLLAAPQTKPQWLRAGINCSMPAWGLRDGIVFGLWPAEFRPEGGAPRGLLRIGYPVLKIAPGSKREFGADFDTRYDLVNFIAIEPIVRGKRGYSELETSSVDGKPGKLFLTDGGNAAGSRPAFDPGRISNPKSGVEQLEVTIHVERFQNGAEVDLIVSIRSDAPDELVLTIQSRAGGRPMELCILTATKGKMARTRELFIADGVLRSRELYRDFAGTGFAAHTVVPREKLKIDARGDLIAAICNDEANPRSERPFAPENQWYWGGDKVTQYWKLRKNEIDPAVTACVNARATYYGTDRTIPGGVAFENFELRSAFKNGQSFIFGITKKTPKDLGF
ncbi:MAG: hypothetical protein HY286_00200 [Planctomycetes bacterium]|nr:hypothetical protein [Planctomycetota bacterium]